MQKSVEEISKKTVKDTFKEVFEEVSKLKSLEESIALAIKREEEARAFYLEKEAEAGDLQLKDLYAYFAGEEQKHAEYLEGYREKEHLPEVEITVPAFQSFAPEFKESKTQLGAIGVLIAAMRHERKSEYFYSELAKRAGKESQRKFFEILANYERGHYELIDNYLGTVTEFRMQT